MLLGLLLTTSQAATWIGRANVPGVLGAPPAAVRLVNGDVLFTGGDGAAAAFSGEFVPGNNAWIPLVMPPGSPIGRSALVRLNDGRVLLTGGLSNGTASAACRFFSPVSRTWRNAPSMAVPRVYHTAHLLLDGRVLVVGGDMDPNSQQPTASCELFDPIMNTWSSAASLTTPRAAHAAVMLPNGQVFACGGYIPKPPFVASSPTTASAERYDPATDAWLSAPSMSVDRNYHSSLLINDAEVRIDGGYSQSLSDTVETSESYDIAADMWRTPTASIPRHAHSIAFFDADHLLLIGGYTRSSSTPTAECWLYTLSTGEWKEGPRLNEARGQHATTTLSDGTILVVGGGSVTGWLSTVELCIKQDKGHGKNFFCGIAGGSTLILGLLALAARRRSLAA